MSTPSQHKFKSMAALALMAAWPAMSAATGSPTATPNATLAARLEVGDVVFIRLGARPAREIAQATASWTNHVGVVVDTSGREPLVGESRVPLSGTTGLSAFLARSEGGRVAVARLAGGLTPDQRQQVRAAADRRAGILSDTGFDVHSPRQFCSRYVRDVLMEATGAVVGEVETFSHLLLRQPDAALGFWQLWYFGRIPWERETVTPASLLRSAALRPVFDGVASGAEADVSSNLGH